MINVYLVWLEWPEKCFRVDAEALRLLKTLVPKGSKVIRVRSEAAFLRALPKASHVIVWNFKQEWFAKAPRLKMLSTPAAGRELVPVEGPNGVRIHFGHFHGDIIAEAVVGFIVAWAHGFFAIKNAPKKEARWPRTWLSDKCYEVAGTNAMIVGYGNIGRVIGSKLEALGVNVYGFKRNNIKSLSKLAKEADWLILALPSTTGTDNLLNAALIRKLPRRCVVVNIGRGNAIDEQALCSALRTRRLAGAYLDVRRHEPSGTVPEFGSAVEELDELDNCVIMPHSSAFSPHYLRKCFKELKDDGCL